MTSVFQLKIKDLVLAVCSFLLFVLAFSQDAALAAFDPSATFKKKCSSCHSIGGGDLKGPDLKGITSRRSTEWLIKFIQSSESMIQSGDAEAIKIYKKYDEADMPDQKLSDQEVVEILSFIDSGGSQAASLDVKSATDATPDDIAQGLKLFLGTKRFSNGGPPCVSCHSVGNHGPLGGGTLGKDLTHIYSDYKDQGLSIALKNLGFPIMSEVYAQRKLTDEEAFQLKAFLYDEDIHGIAEAGFGKKFFFLGLAGLVLGMGIIDFSWRRRRKKSVRRFRGGLR